MLFYKNMNTLFSHTSADSICPPTIKRNTELCDIFSEDSPPLATELVVEIGKQRSRYLPGKAGECEWNIRPWCYIKINKYKKYKYKIMS